MVKLDNLMKQWLKSGEKEFREKPIENAVDAHNLVVGYQVSIDLAPLRKALVEKKSSDDVKYDDGAATKRFLNTEYPYRYGLLVCLGKNKIVLAASARDLETDSSIGLSALKDVSQFDIGEKVNLLLIGGKERISHPFCRIVDISNEELRGNVYKVRLEYVK